MITSMMILLNIFFKIKTLFIQSINGIKIIRFVQFGADQDCHCGAKGCRLKLGVKPNKSKFPSSDAALKIVACQVAINSPKVKAVLYGKDVCMSFFLYIKIQQYVLWFYNHLKN